MKKEFSTNSAKFVYSKKELAYQEVLDRFETANEITIITYNISEKQNSLINALKKAGDHCVINIITNIPSRWESYYGDTFRDKAKKKINLYMTKLNPDNLGLKASVFFDFSNHGKIIMTDSIVYVGSANYSEESANNTEFGLISDDKNLLEFINTEVLPDIQKAAIPFYEYDYTALLLEANVALSAIFNVKNELYEEVHNFHDDFDGKWDFYKISEATLTESTLDSVIKIVTEACRVASDIYDAIDVITKSDEDETTIANDSYEELLDISSYIEEIREYDTLVKLSEFNSDDYINQLLQEKYAFDAYEENLEKCIEDASEEAQSIVIDLALAAEEDVYTLLDEIKKFSDCYAAFIENLRKREIKKISPTIDNT